MTILDGAGDGSAPEAESRSAEHHQQQRRTAVAVGRRDAPRTIAAFVCDDRPTRDEVRRHVHRGALIAAAVAAQVEDVGPRSLRGERNQRGAHFRARILRERSQRHVADVARQQPLGDVGRRDRSSHDRQRRVERRTVAHDRDAHRRADLAAQQRLDVRASSRPVRFVPSTATVVSPACTPAFAAGLPSKTESARQVCLALSNASVTPIPPNAVPSIAALNAFTSFAVKNTEYGSCSPATSPSRSNRSRRPARADRRAHHMRDGRDRSCCSMAGTAPRPSGRACMIATCGSAMPRARRYATSPTRAPSSNCCGATRCWY